MIRKFIQYLILIYGKITDALRWQRDVIFAKPKVDRYSIDFDDVKVTFNWNGWPQNSMSWTSMCDCVVYQTDQFSYELVHLRIGGTDGAKFHCHDFSDGFEAFLTAADVYFPGFKKVIDQFTYDGRGKWETIAPLAMVLALGKTPKIEQLENVLKP